ncbi:hypothetical protein Tco_0953086 [Tanacetum coccineum]|uniref:Uncharacterized protein n=1 Tax=Tanacetum coccineum TaxID=301880 RepID=A0ABQ5E1R8_9ASTR
MTHPHPKRSFVPQAVLTKSGKLSTAGAAVNTVKTVNTANTKVINTVRSVNIAASKPIMNHPKTKTNAFKRGYLQSSRPFNRHFANKNSSINTNFNTAKVKHTTARDRAVGNQQQKEYKEKGIIDNACSRHMTGNKCYLDEYEDYMVDLFPLVMVKEEFLVKQFKLIVISRQKNIILQGLPPEVYALVSNHKVAKELWERIKLLMQETSLTKQERECKLYDEFDKFAYKKGKHYASST